MFDVGVYRFDVSCRTSLSQAWAAIVETAIDLRQSAGKSRPAAWAGYFGVPALPTIVHIVDDEPSVRKAVSRLLRAPGYDVVAYESAAELLQRLATKKASGCIVLDMVMPGISGLTVKDQLQRLGSVLPIVFMTGSDELMQNGPEEVLTKPRRFHVIRPTGPFGNQSVSRMGAADDGR